MRQGSATLAGAAGVGAAATAGLAVGIAGGTAYGLARGTGWVLENTLFRPQQGSEDAAVQDVRSANGMNDATQPQHFSLRTGSSTSGSPASSRSVRLRCPGAAQHAWGLPRGSAPVSELAAPVPGSHAGACLRPALTSWRKTLRLPNLHGFALQNAITLVCTSMYGQE